MKISQKDLAKSLGIGLSNIARYEQGRLPDAEILIKLAEFFNVSIDYLLTSKQFPEIRDHQLLQLTENIDKLGETDKEFIKNTLSNYLQSKAS